MINSYVFWIGDLNFRIDGLTNAEVRKLATSRELEPMFKYDQVVSAFFRCYYTSVRHFRYHFDAPTWSKSYLNVWMLPFTKLNDFLKNYISGCCYC